MRLSIPVKAYRTEKCTEGLVRWSGCNSVWHPPGKPRQNSKIILQRKILKGSPVKIVEFSTRRSTAELFCEWNAAGWLVSVVWASAVSAASKLIRFIVKWIFQVYLEIFNWVGKYISISPASPPQYLLQPLAGAADKISGPARQTAGRFAIKSGDFWLPANAMYV